MKPYTIRILQMLSLLTVFFSKVSAKASKWEFDQYRYLSYDQMRANLYKLQTLYPNIMKVETSEEKFGISHFVDCGADKCFLDIVTISDFQASSEDKVQAYISGALHGDEIIGPNAAYYLIEYLLSNYIVDSQVTSLLKSREIVITPMTNAVGYYYYEREERINKAHPDYKNNKLRKRNFNYAKWDINRDFPYNIESEKCLNTIAGRVVHELFVSNLFVSAVTFHGGTNVIGYPWGAFNRVDMGVQPAYRSRESPDQLAFEGVGWSMKNSTGSSIGKTTATIDEYIFGDISSTIYPVNGGLEDWGYGGGWDFQDEATNFECKPQTYILKNVNQSKEGYGQSIRTAIYIVETDQLKHPNELLLGGRMVEKRLNGKFHVLNESITGFDPEYDGHINRNIRLALTIIEMSKPYIEVVSYIEKDDSKVEITWRVNGCYILNEASIVLNGLTIFLLKENETGYCNYLNGRATSQSLFTMEIDKNDTFVLQAVVDQEFGKSVNPSKVDPSGFANQPQLHLSRLRTLDNYEVRKGDKVIKGSRVIKLTKEQCKISLMKPTLKLDLQERGLQTNISRSSDNSNSLSCVLTTVVDHQISGIFSLIEQDDGSFVVNGQLNHVPIVEEFKVMIMEYGDFSSLAVEYPDYNSLGRQILEVQKISSPTVNNGALKIQETFNLTNGIKSFSDLAGRALIVTKATDLVAYGILANESSNSVDLQSKSTPVPAYQIVNAVALCINTQSTVQYRAIFNLQQKGPQVSFSGMLRTSSRMEDEDELIVSLNYEKNFDLDFDNAYEQTDQESDYKNYLHPCYKIKEETVDKQDLIAGRTLMMYGQNELYFSKILEQSKCHIGLQNPSYRISDESFCRQDLSFNSLKNKDRKYNSTALINFFLIGFVCGGMIGFCLWLSAKMTFKNDVVQMEDVNDMNTAHKMDFVELTNLSGEISKDHDDNDDDI